MALYLICIIDKAGDVSSSVVKESATDRAAMRLAEPFVTDRDVELWCDNRLVCTLHARRASDEI